MLRKSPILAAALAAVLGVSGFLLLRDDEANTPIKRLAEGRADFASNDPLERGCGLERKLLTRIWRGHHPGRSEDVLIVPRFPNYSGSFEIPNHSGPWDYLQNVPLVLYGPRHIQPGGEPISGPASITDVFATAGALTGVDLPARESRVLDEALRPDADEVPRLIITLVWDGVGRNVLERWPDAWPNLARLEREGTSYLDATVGSSPSITPATHANLGTGTYPRTHQATSITLRAPNGEIRDVFPKMRPFDLKTTTFADEIDRELGNESLVGMIAWRNWHLGMMGHGAALPGGDHDQLALIAHSTRLTTNERFYEMPTYLRDFPGLKRRAAQADRADGTVDGRWLGHKVLEMHDNPTWIWYLSDVLHAVIEREGYGQDDVPDFLFTNFKMTDIVGHQYTMDSREMAGVLEEQDRALGRLVDYLDESVGDYVLVLTADHGHTPAPQGSGGWPVAKGELEADIEEHFASQSDELVENISATGIFLDGTIMNEVGVEAEEIARFVNDYTLKENWPEKKLPKDYVERADEQVFSAAFTEKQLPEVMECAFDARDPAAP